MPVPQVILRALRRQIAPVSDLMRRETDGRRACRRAAPGEDVTAKCLADVSPKGILGSVERYYAEVSSFSVNALLLTAMLSIELIPRERTPSITTLYLARVIET